MKTNSPPLRASFATTMLSGWRNELFHLFGSLLVTFVHSTPLHIWAFNLRAQHQLHTLLVNVDCLDDISMDHTWNDYNQLSVIFSLWWNVWANLWTLVSNVKFELLFCVSQCNSIRTQKFSFGWNLVKPKISMSQKQGQSLKLSLEREREYAWHANKIYILKNSHMDSLTSFSVKFWYKQRAY